MADILSQDEIDQLLAAISNGADDTPSGLSKKVRIFDLKHPDLVSASRKYWLEKVFGSFSESAQTYISSELTMPCAIRVGAIDTLSLEEFFRSVPGFSPHVRIDWNDANEHPLIMQMDEAPAATIFDHLTGDRGEAPEVPRMFTSFQKRVLWRIFKDIIERLHLVLTQLQLELPLKIGSIEHCVNTLMAFDKDELAIVVTAEIKVGSIEGMMNFALPRKFIRFLWPLETERPKQSGRRRQPGSAHVILESALERLTYARLKNLKSGMELKLISGSERTKYGVG